MSNELAGGPAIILVGSLVRNLEQPAFAATGADDRLDVVVPGRPIRDRMFYRVADGVIRALFCLAVAISTPVLLVLGVESVLSYCMP